MNNDLYSIQTRREREASTILLSQSLLVSASLDVGKSQHPYKLPPIQKTTEWNPVKWGSPRLIDIGKQHLQTPTKT